jgi:hypothetical protein
LSRVFLRKLRGILKLLRRIALTAGSTRDRAGFAREEEGRWKINGK